MCFTTLNVSWIHFMNQQDLLIKRIQISTIFFFFFLFLVLELMMFSIYFSLAKYTGCYVDDTQKRALRGVSFFDYKKMTVFRCQDNCAERYSMPTETFYLHVQDYAHTFAITMAHFFWPLQFTCSGNYIFCALTSKYHDRILSLRHYIVCLLSSFLDDH